MGMDVYGLKPKTQKGEYFRNNVWWWHPLWSYCCHISPELAGKVQNGHDNSGDGLDAVDSRKLGFIVQQSVTSGAAQEYVDEYNKDTATLPDEPCFCVKQSLMDVLAMSADTPFVEVSGILKSSENKTPNPECKNCKGSGMQRNWNANYYIDVENIQNFAGFLIDCGGFEIC